jgi:hypothetical protein
MSEQPVNNEMSGLHEIGILFDKLPEPGVVVGGYDVDKLKTHPKVVDVALADYQSEIGASQAISYHPGIKSKYGWEYSEYMIFDSQKRPMGTSKMEAGISSSRSFQYDELGRLVKMEDNFGFIRYTTTEYEYTADIPDETGKYPFTVKETKRSGLRSV